MCALALWLSGRKTDSATWALIGLTYLLGVFVLTREINIPINEALALWDLPQNATLVADMRGHVVP
ncbi:MAG: hypothetical protein H0X13_17405 [Ramlibacter sp.]|nr:hypothetical protein [Ramlibacter sp.]